jgi:AcrR family transcriptional regulator
MQSAVPPDRRVAVRRPPYGANPALGRHGTRARAEILDAARRLFAERGYHGTTVEAIGEASGRSGASVYQYFECKAAIFGLFVDELCDEVLPSARELFAEYPGGRPATTLPEMQRRIARLAEMLGRHATTFALWPVAEQSDPVLQETSRQFMDAFAEAVQPGLDASGVAAGRQRTLAIGLGAMVQWSHATRTARAPDLDPAVLDRVLAQVVQGALFGEGPDRECPAPVPLTVPRPEGARRGADPRVVPGVRRPVTPRGQVTLDRILAAATTAFRRNGFHGTSINDIASAAGVSHGSVYTYWPDRSSLFASLAHRAAVAIGDHIEEAAGGFSSRAEACAWLERWLDLVDEHGTVLHTWTHEVLVDEQLGPLAQDMALHVNAFLDVLLRSAPTAGQVDETAARLVIWSLLTDIPYTHHVQMGSMTRAELLDVLTALLLRGLLGLRI